MEFSPPKTKVNEMSVLTSNSQLKRLPHGPLVQPSQAASVPQIFDDSVSMDHLDALEA
jgi:hypothetical protein